MQHEDEDFFHSRKDASDTDRGSDAQWFLAPPFYPDPDALMPVLKRQQERLEKITSTPGLLPVTRLNGTLELACLTPLILPLFPAGPDEAPVHIFICLSACQCAIRRQGHHCPPSALSPSPRQSGGVEHQPLRLPSTTLHPAPTPRLPPQTGLPPTLPLP